MKVCIFTLGSRGDVQPYVALAKGLIEKGHSAVVCTGESFRNFVEENGVAFVKTTSDLMAIASTPEGKAILENPIKNMKLALRYSKEVINPAFRKTLDDFFEAAKAADIIVYHPKALGAVDIALHLGIPCVSMPPVPITYPVTEFPNLAVTHKNLGSFLNKLTYKVNEQAEKSQLAEINDFRSKSLGLEKRKAGIYTYNDGSKDIPIIYPISKYLFPDVTSWNRHVYLSGFFYLDNDKEKLPKEVELFLTEGEIPIAITFSSMPLKQPEVFVQKLKAALEQTNNRAILLVGNSGIEYKSDKTLCVTKYAPHHLLFEKVKGVIHHGGVGTLAAVLRAGIPQQIIPFSVDQPFWAERLYKLGYSLKPLNEKTLTIGQLGESFQEMENPKIRIKAKEISDRIKRENGIENAVIYLEILEGCCNI